MKEFFTWIAKNLVKTKANRAAQTNITIINTFKYEKYSKFNI